MKVLALSNCSDRHADAEEQITEKQWNYFQLPDVQIPPIKFLKVLTALTVLGKGP